MKIFYISPQSISSLAAYDYNLLSNIEDCKLYYLCSCYYNNLRLPRVKYLPVFKYNKKNNAVTKSLSYTFSILKIIFLINKLQPNIIHIQWFKLWQIDNILLRYAHYKKIKVIHTAHNVLPHNQEKNDFKIYSKYYQLVNHIIVHSENTKRELINTFNIDNLRVSVIPHGVLDLSQMVDTDKIEQIKQEFIQQYDLKNKIVFSLLGTLQEYKGTDIVLQVWNKYFKNNSNIFLFVIGENQLKADISYVHNFENVYTNLNKVSNELFFSVTKLTSVGLLPYRRISQSGVLLSIINENIPFLVSNVGGLSEPLSIADVGWNIGKPTEENLLEYMRKMTINNVLEKRNKNNDWERLKRYYSWKEIGNRTQKLYQSI